METSGGECVSKAVTFPLYFLGKKRPSLTSYRFLFPFLFLSFTHGNKKTKEPAGRGEKIDLKTNIKAYSRQIVHIPDIPGILFWLWPCQSRMRTLPPSLPFVSLIHPLGSGPASFHSCFRAASISAHFQTRGTAIIVLRLLQKECPKRADLLKWAIVG